MSVEDDLAKDDMPHRFQGSLSFSDQEGNEEANQKTTQPPRAGGSQFDQKRLVFQVISSDEIHKDDAHYVTYTLLVITTPGIDSRHAKVERRYSDFRQLNETLRRKFPRLMQKIPFPPKVIFGNFTNSTIAKRRDAFEIYFRRLDDHEEIKRSTEFVNFFCEPELKRAYELIRLSRYAEARPLLENALKLEEKLGQDSVPTLGALTLCCDLCEQSEDACSYADEALKLCSTSSHRDKYLVPLLSAARDLYFHLGRNRRNIDQQLQALHDTGGTTLLEVVTKRLS